LKQQIAFTGVLQYVASRRGPAVVVKPMSNDSPNKQPTEPGGLTLDVGNVWLADLVDNGRVTPKGMTIARYVAANPRSASFTSASEVAQQTGVNVATVVRFAQRVGFSGWPEFQLHLRHHYLGSLLPSGLMRDHQPVVADSPLEGALRRDAQNLQDALTSIDFEAGTKVARLIADAPRTLVVSSGSYAAVGQIFAHLARFMGYDVSLETRGGAHLVAALSTFKPGDCLLVINFWRVVKEVLLTTQYCRRQGMTTIAITDSLFSPQAQAAEHALIVPTESVSFFQSMTAAVSLVHGLLAELQQLGGDEVDSTIERLEAAYADLDVLFT
jgi:DNA-binding MurR/RpiR family transcriptional regulator